MQQATARPMLLMADAEGRGKTEEHGRVTPLCLQTPTAPKGPEAEMLPSYLMALVGISSHLSTLQLM